MKRLLFLFLILAVSSCGGNNHKKSKQKFPVKVGVITISTSQSYDQKVYVGEVDASSSTVVSASHIGVLNDIKVRQGSQVKQGDVMAEIISKNVQASYEISHATLRQAEDGYERVKKVHESGTVADVKMIEIETQLAKARAAAKMSEESLEECKIKAPFDGTVSNIIAEEGVQVNPGTPIIHLVDVSTIVVNIPVPEGEVGKVKIGQKAIIDVPALNLSGIEAKIKSKGVIAKFPSHTYECTISPVCRMPELLPGMVCKVRIQDELSAETIIVPASSVEVDNGGRYVWTVKDGVVHKTYITVKGFQDKGVKVTSGLNLGDSVIVLGASKVSTGMHVEVVEQTI